MFTINIIDGCVEIHFGTRHVATSDFGKWYCEVDDKSFDTIEALMIHLNKIFM